MSASDFRAWALKRIDECRAMENKFLSSVMDAPDNRRSRTSALRVPQTAIEAWTQRVTLQIALEILGDDGAKP